MLHPAHPQHPSPKLRSVLLLSLVSIVFTLFVVETVVYFVPDLIPPIVRSSYFQPTPEDYSPGTILNSKVGYTYAPDLVDFEVPFEDTYYSISTVSLGYDQVGFRDNGMEGEPFAVVIGDSFTSCVGVEMEACWVERLEDKTSRDFANLGVVGHGSHLEQRVLAEYGLPLQPKVILWTFFANDLIQAWRFDQFGQGAVATGRFWENPVKRWLAEHSAIYLVGSYIWYERYFFYHLNSDNPTVAADPTLAWWLAYGDLSVPEVSAGLDLTQQVILKASQQSQAQLDDAKFVVVIIPFREQIHYLDSEFQTVLDGPNEAIRKFCQENGLSVIDLTSALRESGKSESAPLYFDQDSHLNQRGNEIVADHLKRELEVILVED